MSDFLFQAPMHGAIDPLASVAAQTRPNLPKRFYKAATVEARDGGFVVLLDGRVAKTPTKVAMVLPDTRIAGLVAAEWAAQGEVIDPTVMPLTRLANSALCGVADQMSAVADEIIRYTGTDMVCYRAGSPAALAELQAAAWDPVLAWARETSGARFVAVEGVMHAAQPATALAAVRAAVEACIGQGAAAPFRLAALSVMTTLTGSALLALQCAGGAADLDAAWAAAHVDEDFEIALWGEDGEAQLRRANRWRDFAAAGAMLGAG